MPFLIELARHIAYAVDMIQVRCQRGLTRRGRLRETHGFGDRRA